MSSRTVVIINNDWYGLVATDPNFGLNLREAIIKYGTRKEPVPVKCSPEFGDHVIANVVHYSHVNQMVSLRLIDFNAHEILE